MFGLMQPDSCANNESSYTMQRMHYCGTCKVIGKEYGQKSRLLLNYDAAFLAELLTALSALNPSEWEPQLRAVNRCFTLPKKSSQSPEALHYAAAANMLFAKLKIADNIVDHSKLWRIAGKVFKTNFKSALNDLESWGLNLIKIQVLSEEQTLREQLPTSKFNTFESYINYISEPSAKICAEVFSGASVAIAKPELSETLYRLGYSFGKLVYCLDAMEDLEKDIAKLEFNPYRSFYGPGAVGARNNSIDYLDTLRADTELAINELPLDNETKAFFAARLLTNLCSRTSKIEWKDSPKLNLSDRIKRRYRNAKQIADAKFCTPNSFSGNLQYNFMLWAAFISPQSAGKGVMGSQSSYLIAVLGALGLLLAGYSLPIKGKKFRKKGLKKNLFNRRKDCGDNWSESCETCGIILFLGILFILFLLVGMLVFGIILITQGYVFWGIFAMLILPLIFVLFSLWSSASRKRKARLRAKRES